LLNYLTRFVGKVMRYDHALDKPFRRIAICKFKGMGSIIQATPMLSALRQKFPDAEIIFVSTKTNEQFLKKIDMIDTIITIDDKGIFKLLATSMAAIFKFWKKRPDVYIDLEIYSNFSTLIALFSLSKNRIGFYLRESSYRLGIYTHMMFFNPRVAISDVYLQIARLFGEIPAEISLYPIHKNISYDQSTIPQKKYIIINPNASDLRIERRWAPENFRALIELILKKYPELHILLIGAPSEKDHTQTVMNSISSERVINMASRTSMDELIGLIKNAALVITNDTGPMHISFACDTPTVCLFGPCSPEQYGQQNNATIIYKSLYCSPCVHDFTIPPCGGDNMCMKLIGVNEVFEAVCTKLDTVSNSSSAGQEHPFYGAENKVFGLVKRN
jgi:ADP-heptose:LPS heptosyltransferase